MAAIELDFVDDIPQPKRRRLDPSGRVVVRSSGRPTKVTETGDRYVAPDSHRAHGTYVKYVVEKCRCLPCTEANRTYELRRQQAIHRPDESWVPYVPATRARNHLLDLAAKGVGPKTVATMSGVSHGSLSKIMYGDKSRRQRPSKRIRPETERKILAVTFDMANGGQKIDGTATWQLIEDLYAQGFYRQWIAEQLGTQSGNLRQRPLVRASTARKVEKLHKEWSGKTPPRKRSRWHQ